MTVQLRFLGTGASGGTPGEGRSARRESSALVRHGHYLLLLDATRDLGDQLDDAGVGIADLDGVALTHGHRDASGGVPELVRRLRAALRGPLPVLASPRTHDVLRGRYARLDGLELVGLEPGTPATVAEMRLCSAAVPHDPSARFPTAAWRIDIGGSAIVYASDVAHPTPALERLATGADILVADGATYGRRMFSHLRIDEDLVELCRWDVTTILLTQIGRSAPPHDELDGVVAAICSRARPAYDGLTLRL